MKLSQQVHFSDVILCVKKNKPLTKLHSLSPFLDNNGLLRVGGRLSFSKLDFERKHPLIIDRKCHLSATIAQYYHLNLLHSGSSTTNAIMRKKFWVISARSLIKKVIHNCSVCLRARKSGHQPVMAALPTARVTPVRCFYYTGLDFAGPFSLKSSKLKKAPITKGYFVVFICLTTRAIHVELCTELTTDCFLAAFNRFTSRRSTPSELFSDCGSNFKGAARHYKEITEFLQEKSEDISSYCTTKGMKWNFLPPYASNFGGSWEIHVKLIKQLMYKQLGSTILTYEEMSTILIRTEAIINSRPLCILSSSIEDIEFLTPSHFLTQSCLLSPPEVEVEYKMSLKNRWDLVQSISQQIWKTWHREYLHSIIQRNKWTKNIKNPQIGQSVYLLEMNSGPLKWPLGVIIKLHPSKDGVVRVVTVRSKGCDYVRPCNKLILFPLYENSASSLAAPQYVNTN